MIIFVWSDKTMFLERELRWKEIEFKTGDFQSLCAVVAKSDYSRRAEHCRA
jgi:hypothetical protein